MIEELAFRGFLLRRLIDADFTSVEPDRAALPAIALSSLAFGALHQSWLAGTLTGLLFAAALLRRGRLADAVVAHATANAVLALLVLGTGRWSLWL